MLSKNQFEILNAIRLDNAISTQKELAQRCDLSLGTVNAVIRDAVASKWVAQDATFSLTHKGREQLEPYKVENAVIMAAGLSSRFAPISYEKPKGLLKVRGEVLIERQIRQLQEAGIKNIVLVVGYMKEKFFYLGEKFDITIVVNEVYASRNNNSTLWRVRNILGNTYICSSDDYFTENVFDQYVYMAYYPGVYVEGHTPEYCMHAGAHSIIDRVSVGGSDSWVMLGHAYFDREFSKRFVSILESTYSLPETAGKLWEDIYVDNIHDLHMELRKYPDGVIREFDSLEELSDFDPDFIDNVSSKILDNICEVLDCTRHEVEGIVPIKQGLTNLSFRFEVDGTLYVYRHPGDGTEKIINRKSETYAQGIARSLGIDDTFIYEDPDQGWKISRFIDGCIPFDYHNDAHVRGGLALARKLHQSKTPCEWTFDVYQKACGIVELLGPVGRTAFDDFDLMSKNAEKLSEFVSADGVEPCLCHNDFYDPNFLVGADRIRLIDWEYSGLSDYASDLGTFICCSDYTYDEAVDAISIYFGHAPTLEELRHCIAYVGLSAWYWFVWAIYQDTVSSPVGEYLYTWYRFANEYARKAIELYSQS